MKISAKGRYGLAAMTYLACNYAAGTPITIVSISEKLGISKIYLEQVFSLLKRARLVNSIKGSQGGYQLARAPREITPYDILSSIELSLMEKTAPAAQEKMPELDRALASCVFTHSTRPSRRRSPPSRSTISSRPSTKRSRPRASCTSSDVP